MFTNKSLPFCSQTSQNNGSHLSCYILVSYLFFKALLFGCCPHCFIERTHKVSQCLPCCKVLGHFFLLFCIAWKSFLVWFLCVLSLLVLQKTASHWFFWSSLPEFSLLTIPALIASAITRLQIHITGPTFSRPVFPTVCCLIRYIILPTGHQNTPGTSYSACLKQDLPPLLSHLLHQQKALHHSYVMYPGD